MIGWLDRRFWCWEYPANLAVVSAVVVASALFLPDGWWLWPVWGAGTVVPTVWLLRRWTTRKLP